MMLTGCWMERPSKTSNCHLVASIAHGATDLCFQLILSIMGVAPYWILIREGKGICPLCNGLRSKLQLKQYFIHLFE